MWKDSVDQIQGNSTHLYVQQVFTTRLLFQGIVRVRSTVFY